MFQLESASAIQDHKCSRSNNSPRIAPTVAVGMPVAQHPRTDPYVRNSRIRLLSWMTGVEASVGIGVQKEASGRTAGLYDAIRRWAAGSGVEACFATACGVDAGRCSSSGDFPAQRGIDGIPARRSAATSRSAPAGSCIRRRSVCLICFSFAIIRLFAV
jgi:hypothetical protein